MINNLLFFWIYIYIYIYTVFGISVSLSTVSDLFWGELLETVVILLETLVPVKSPVASAVF